MKWMQARVILAAMVCPLAVSADEPATVLIDGQGLVSYQAKPLANPVGGERFQGSHFIHPLKTPSGFVLTELQPDDHLHHFGLWWPWKYLETGGRKVLCWELQEGDGIIQATKNEPVPNGLRAGSIYLDRRAPGGPKVLLHETVHLQARAAGHAPETGYLLDLAIVNRTAGDQPITVTPYRYSGFSLRGTLQWNRDNSTVLTSEGMTRDTSNFTHARWVRVEGDTQSQGKAGILLMSHPDNHAHPEKLRTWDQTQHEGAVFINFNPVSDEPWVFEPGRAYTRNYRLYVYDGTITAADAEDFWRAYAAGGDPAESEQSP